MDEAIRQFGETFGRRALARDWAGVHGLLAPWLQRALPVDQVQAFFENEYRLTLEDSNIQDMHYPAHPDPDIGGNTFMTAASLRGPISFAGGKVRPVDPEVTDENLRFWMRLQLQCSDEQMDRLGFDFFCEVWMAIVETPDGLRVGYWGQGAY